MSKEDIINYVMTTPGNPNRAVLNGMLDSVGEGGSSGYSVDTKRVEIYNGSFTTELDPIDNVYPAYIEATTVLQNDPDVIYVTYDGLNYVCNAKKPIDDFYYYGADMEYDAETDSQIYNFTEYPFEISFYRENSFSEIDFMCKDPGNHTVNISIDEPEIKVTTDFVNASMLAVTGKASSEPMYKIEDTDVLYDGIIPDVVRGAGGADDLWIVFTNEKIEGVYNKLEQYKTYINPYIVTFDGVKRGSQMEYTDSTNSGRLALKYDEDSNPDIYLCMDFNSGMSPNALYLEDAEGNRIDLSTFGSHTLKLEINNETITTSEDFVKVVNSLNQSEAAEPIYLTIPYSSDKVQTGVSSKDPDEIYALYMSGKPLVFNYRQSTSTEGYIYIPTEVQFEHAYSSGMSKCIFYINKINYTNAGDLYFDKEKFTILRNNKVAQREETQFYITKDYVKPYDDGITG